MAGIAKVVVVLAFASPSLSSAAQGRLGVRGASSDRRVSTREVEVRLRDSLDAELHERSLARIDGAMWETFQALPKNEMGRLEPRAVRHIVHSYFAKEHGWIINGLEANGMQLNASEVHEVGILQDKAPAFVEALLEAKRAGRGLSLSDVVAMAAALERLIVEESFSLLRDAYTLNGQTVVDAVDDGMVHSVLSSYLLIFEMGILGSVTDVRRHRATKRAIAASADFHWDTIVQFEKDAVSDFDFESRHRTNPFVPRKYSFAETSRMVEGLAHDYGKWQNAECRLMKEVLAEMDQDGSGRVPLKSFYSKPETAKYQFKESVEYLRLTGALDEATNSVRIVNYLTGPSNCVAKSTYYSVCCLSECEGLMSELERKIRAPSTSPEHLLGAISNLTSVEDMRLPKDAALGRLRAIADHNDGEVPLHGRLFAEFLHYAFPMDCPYPHVAEDAAVLAPTSWNSTEAAVTDEERRIQLDAEGLLEGNVTDEPAWSSEELLPLIEPAKHGPLGAWSGVALAVVQCAAFGAALRSAIAGLRVATGAGFGKGQDKDLALPVRM